MLRRNAIEAESGSDQRPFALETDRMVMKNNFQARRELSASHIILESSTPIHCRGGAIAKKPLREAFSGRTILSNLIILRIL